MSVSTERVKGTWNRAANCGGKKGRWKDIHSYLIVKYSEGDKVAMNVGEFMIRLERVRRKSRVKKEGKEGGVTCH
jgi:hypothetical protein